MNSKVTYICFSGWALLSGMAAPNVTILRIANQGSPDRFARLLSYAQTLTKDYLAGTKPAPDPFEAIAHISPTAVTGRAYAWMSDKDCYHPGGDFVRIPDSLCGRLAGNRFYTHEKRAADRNE